MKLTDIIALAKSGYKKSDIDELLKIEIDTEEPEETEEETEETEEPEETEETEEKEEETEEKDYKKLYEKQAEEMKKLSDKLDAIQKKNRRQNVKKEEETFKLDDIVRKFM